MLDEKDLQAIAEMISASETRMRDHMDEAIEITERRMQILMEGFFTPRFNLLAENQQIIREQMVKKEDLTVNLEDIQAEILLLRTAVKRNAKEIEKLKKAQ